MEIGNIIKWVDHTSSLLYIVKTEKEFKADGIATRDRTQEFKRFRKEYKENWGFIPEYGDYIGVLKEKMLYMNQTQQKQFLQLLFRDSGVFFDVCREIKKKYKECWYIYALSTYGNIKYDMIEQTYGALFFDLFNFYREVFFLSNICNISINQISPLNEYSDLVEDLMYHWVLITQQKTGENTLEAYIIKDAQKVLKAIDVELSNYTKPQGKRIALIVCALEQYGYIANIDGNVEKIYEAFRLRYPNKVATRQAVTQYINAHRNPMAKTDKPQFTEKELRGFIDKI